MDRPDAPIQASRQTFLQRVAQGARPRAHHFIPIVVALLAAAQSSFFVRLPAEDLAKRGVALDDAYFYLVIARNFPGLGYMTFDGQMPTNGVQPLWQALLIAYEYLMPSHDQLAWSLGTSWALYAVFSGLVVHFARAELRLSLASLTAFCALIPLNPQFQRATIQGLETSLFLVAVMVWALALAAYRAPPTVGPTQPWARVVMLALCSALLFFTRTDWFVAAPVTLFVVWLTTRRSQSAAIFCGVLLLLVGPYLLHNWLVYGHPMPISGRVKLFYLQTFFPSWSAYFSSDEWRGMFVLFADVFHLDSVILAAALALMVSVLGVATWRQCPASVKPLILAAALHGVLMHLVYRELRPYTRYYFCGEAIVAVLLLTLALERLLARNWSQARGWRDFSREQWTSIAVTASAAAFIAAQPTAAPPVSASWRLRVEMAHALEQLPTSAKLAAFWPGALAYFAQRPVFPLDGIVGSDRYFQEVVKPGKEIDYARAQGLDYIVTSFAPPEVVASDQPPELSSWSELGVLRLWEACKYLQGVVLERSDGPRRWRVYGLSPDVTGWLECLGRP